MDRKVYNSNTLWILIKLKTTLTTKAILHIIIILKYCFDSCLDDIFNI